MPTVTPDDVRAVIDTDIDLTLVIESAQNIYAARLDGQSISETTQLEIVRYIAAAIAWIRDPEARVKSFKVGDLSETYSAADRSDLKSNPFWQIAAATDPTGILGAAATLAPQAEFRVLG